MFPKIYRWTNFSLHVAIIILDSNQSERIKYINIITDNKTRKLMQRKILQDPKQ